MSLCCGFVCRPCKASSTRFLVFLAESQIFALPSVRDKPLARAVNSTGGLELSGAQARRQLQSIELEKLRHMASAQEISADLKEHAHDLIVMVCVAIVAALLYIKALEHFAGCMTARPFPPPAARPHTRVCTTLDSRCWVLIGSGLHNSRVWCAKRTRSVHSRSSRQKSKIQGSSILPEHHIRASCHSIMSEHPISI